MSEINTGGPAFPCTEANYADPKWSFEGMTLRDYFAGQTLASVNLGIGVTEEFYAQTATHCYALADAMLKARSA